MPISRSSDSLNTYAAGDDWELPNVIDQREFDRLRDLHQAGSIMAFIEASVWSLRHNVRPPRWVVAASLKRMISGEGKKVGRAASGLARERQDVIHFLRWDHVEEARMVR